MTGSGGSTLSPAGPRRRLSFAWKLLMQLCLPRSFFLFLA